MSAPASNELTRTPMTDAGTAAAKQAAARTSRFATPGEGSTTLISAVTVVALVALWWGASHQRWLPPQCLPTPQRVFERLFE